MDKICVMLETAVKIRRLSMESICIVTQCSEPDCPVPASQREDGLEGVTRRMNEIRELAALVVKE